jgi:hypothetical protein
VIAAGIALIVAGLAIVLFLGYFGLIVSVVGIVILILALLGIGRGTAASRP